MKKTVFAIAVLALGYAPFALAEDVDVTKIPPEKLAAFCSRSRATRAKIVQDDAKAWLARVAAMKAACTVRWAKTGAVRIDGARAYSELKGDVQCPKGVPTGETKESVWNVLSLFLEDGPATDERISSAHAAGEQMHKACEESDGKAGLVLRVVVTDMPGLQRLLAWRSPADAGSMEQ